MEENKELTITEEAKNNQDELKTFKKVFFYFMLGQIFLMISVFANATIINGVPGWIGFLSLFELVTHFIYLLKFAEIRHLNNSFYKSYITLLIYTVLFLLYGFGNNSKEIFITAAVKGINYSLIFVQATFYLYFFHGIYLLFDKYNFTTGKKKARIALVVYIVLYTIWMLIDQLSGMRLLLTNFFLNRFLVYGKWAMLLIVQTYVLIIAINASKYLKKKIGEEDKNEK